jgi:hypothetical protein
MRLPYVFAKSLETHYFMYPNSNPVMTCSLSNAGTCCIPHESGRDHVHVKRLEVRTSELLADTCIQASCTTGALSPQLKRSCSFQIMISSFLRSSFTTFNRLDSRSHQANLPLKLLKSDVSHRCPQHQRPLTSQLPSIVSEPADVQTSGIMIYLTHATLHDPTKKVRQSRLHAQRSSQQN